MKLLVIGTQLSGKSTLAKYLREHTSFAVLEIDEEIIKANHGEWPRDNQYKDNELIPAIYNRIAKQDDIIFFANQFEPTRLLTNFREQGFKVILLKLGREELLKRNENRVKNENYGDAAQWLDGQLANHQELVNKNFVDSEIDANRPTVEIARDLQVQF